MWITPGGGGALNFGLHTVCHHKDPTVFSLAFTKRPPFLPNFNRWPPIFNKLLVTQRPHIFTFNSQEWQFWAKNWIFDNFGWNVEKFFLKALFFFFSFFYAFHWKTPIFLCALSLKDPPCLMQFVTERPLHLRCLVSLVRHFYMWVPPPWNHISTM